MGQICEYIQYVILIFTYPLPLLPLTGSYKLECLNPRGLLCLVKEVQHKMAGGVGVCIGGLGSEVRLPHSHISAAHELYDLPWPSNLTALTRFPHQENRLTVPTSPSFCKEYYKATGFKTERYTVLPPNARPGWPVIISFTHS